MAVLEKIQDTAGWVEAKINALAVYFTWFIEGFQSFKQKMFLKKLLTYENLNLFVLI